MIVRLKGVKKATAKGQVYYYHRKTKTRLPGEPGSAEFIAKLQALDAKKAPPLPGTLGALVKAYRASPEFTGLAKSTQVEYQSVFDELKTLDALALHDITPEWLFGLRDKKLRQRKRSFANLMLAVLKLVFNWGIRRHKCTSNPAAGVERIKRPKDAPTKNRPWRPEELETVMAAAPPWLRVPVALAAYTGLRESDVVRVTWANYDGKAFETRSQKTNMLVWVPAHYKLREILDAAPRTSKTIVVGVRGKSIARSTATNTFFDLLKRLREEGRVGPGLSFHGLRHTLGTALAEMGCDPPTIAAVLGQATTQMAEHYSRTANRRRLTSDAIDRMEQRDRRQELENQMENSS